MPDTTEIQPAETDPDQVADVPAENIDADDEALADSLDSWIANPMPPELEQAYIGGFDGEDVPAENNGESFAERLSRQSIEKMEAQIEAERLEVTGDGTSEALPEIHPQLERYVEIAHRPALPLPKGVRIDAVSVELSQDADTYQSIKLTTVLYPEGQNVLIVTEGWEVEDPAEFAATLQGLADLAEAGAGWDTNE